MKKFQKLFDEASKNTTDEKIRLADYYVETIEDFIEKFCM